MLRILLFSITTIIFCFKLISSVGSQITKPDTVFIPVPFDQLSSIQWLSNPHYMQSTCGNFKAYRGTIKNIVGRWFTVYTSNIPQQTDYCSHFTNVKKPCGCLGIDITLALGHGLITFVMFSRNSNNMVVTYEMGTASLIGNFQINMREIVLWRIMKSGPKIWGNKGYIIPNGVVVDTDNFKTYMILLFCQEYGIKPTIMVVVKTLPIPKNINDIVYNYLIANDLSINLLNFNDSMCDFDESIIGI